MTISLIFTLFLVSLNKKIDSVEQGLEIGGCTLREMREGLGTWPRAHPHGKCAEEDTYTIDRKWPNKHPHWPGASFAFMGPSGGV